MRAIVAVDNNWGIGKNNDLLCYLPKDLKRFKQITKGNIVLMGRKTLESLPNGEPLPNRYNIVLTSNKEYTNKDVLVSNSIPDLLAYSWLIKAMKGVETYVIGGQSIYQQLLPECDMVYVTKINHTFDADKFFPNLDEMKEWYVADESETQNENGLEYMYLTYKRR